MYFQNASWSLQVQFRRLPIGIVVSQDIFQRRLDDIYRNIPNVIGIIDGIIVFGSTRRNLPKHVNCHSSQQLQPQLRETPVQAAECRFRIFLHRFIYKYLHLAKVKRD